MGSGQRDTTQKLHSELERREGELRQVQNELREVKKQLALMAKREQKSQARIEQQQLQKLNVVNEKREVVAKLNEVNLREGKLLARISDLERGKKSNEGLLSVLGKHSQKLQAENEALKQRLQESQAENQRLKGENQRLQEQLTKERLSALSFLNEKVMDLSNVQTPEMPEVRSSLSSPSSIQGVFPSSSLSMRSVPPSIPPGLLVSTQSVVSSKLASFRPPRLNVFQELGVSGASEENGGKEADSPNGVETHFR